MGTEMFPHVMGNAKQMTVDALNAEIARTEIYLRELEDRRDLAEMAKAEAESEGTLSLEELRKELGL